jgi:hypothetical protein
MTKTLLAVVLAAAVAGPASADRADDDLAAVKRAVGSSGEPDARASADSRTRREARAVVEDERPERAEAKARSRSRKDEPQWFRVRIVERGGKRGRVSLNLPLALVRAAGEDWRLPGCHDRKNGPTIGEILRTLDSGQSLVEIDDDDATVRVWVE